MSITDIDNHLKRIDNDFEKNVNFFKKSFKKKGIDIENKQKEDKDQSQDEYVLIALLQAEKIWQYVRKFIICKEKEYNAMKDEEKINIIRKQYKEFYDQFPIVSRYMVCYKQYRYKAFERMLNKSKYAEFNTQKESNENIWIDLQADYIRYLWEEHQTARFTKQQSNQVWEKARKALKEEFTGFKNMHKKIESKVKTDKTKYRAELLKEAIQRIKEGGDYDEDQIASMIQVLKVELVKQKYSKVLEDLMEKVPHIDPCCSGKGTNKEAQNEHEQELKLKEVKKSYNKIMV